MKRLKLSGFILLLTAAFHSNAAILSYTNEADYLAKLSGLGVATFSEGFESSAWEPTRTMTGVPGVLSSQGIDWSASQNLKTNPGWAHTGSYGVYDSTGDPDIIRGRSTAGQLYGVGGYIETSSLGALYGYSMDMRLDGQSAFSFLIPSEPSFFGVIDTDGFTDFTLASSAGHWGADDFILGRAEVPEPQTYLLFGMGLLGLIWMRRRGKSVAAVGDRG